MKILYILVMSVFFTASAMLYADVQEGFFERKQVGPSLSIEYLFWKVQEGQLYPAIFTEQSVEDGVNQSSVTLKNQKFKHASGFRAGVGYNFCYEKYDVKLAWTRLHQQTTIDYSAPNPRGLIVISFFDQTDSDVPHAESIVSQWNLNYDMLDLELGRAYKVGRFLSLHPNIGLKGGWINQAQKMGVANLILGQPAVETVQGSVNRVNEFRGIGPRVGLDLRFGLGSQFGVFSTLSGALLYGKFNLKNVTFLTDTLDGSGAPGNGPQVTTIDNSECGFSPTVQMLLGGDWARCFLQKYWIRLGIAYEVQFWWNQMRSNNSIPQILFINTPAGGDLMMHGLTLQAGFGF
jgi:Legionella pneumophila major outer membrane protein precursor